MGERTGAESGDYDSHALSALMEEITFRLDHFEGPLDLLLHLIAKNKVSIYDIPIAEILEQYMAVLEEAGAKDLEVAGDFIAMAAQLVYLKSKMLLPTSAAAPQEDPRVQLVEQLLEYQRIRQMTPYFLEATDRGRDIFVKAPEPQERTLRTYQQKPDDLIRAARRMLEKTKNRIPPPVSAFQGIVGREPMPVSVKITSILKRFLAAPRLRFLDLFTEARNRSEMVATFLAVLELSKTRRIQIEGTEEDFSLELTEENA